MPPTSKRRKHSPKSNKAKNTHTSRGLVRIIAGTHRGRRLPVLVHEGLRPTGDRVKETLFNWLMNDIQNAQCLDMYAGSGSLGIEALSRGAKHVVFIEQESKAAQQITNNLTTLREVKKANVINSNAFDTSLDTHAPFDIVFIDPPFKKDMLTKSIATLVDNKLLANNAFVYIESSFDDEYTMPTEFSLLKELKTSQVYARLFHLPD